MSLNIIKGYNHFPDYSQVSATLKNIFNIKQLTIVAVTSHYSWVNTYKNIVIPDKSVQEWLTEKKLPAPFSNEKLPYI